MSQHYDSNRTYRLNRDRLQEIWSKPERKDFIRSWEHLAELIGCCLTTLERGRGIRGEDAQTSYKYIESMAEVLSQFTKCDPCDLIAGVNPSTTPGTSAHDARLDVLKHLIDDPSEPALDPELWLKDFDHPGLCTKPKRMLVLRQLSDYGGYFEFDELAGTYKRSNWQPTLTPSSVERRVQHELDNFDRLYGERSFQTRREIGERLYTDTGVAEEYVHNIGYFHSREVALHLIAFADDRRDANVMRVMLQGSWNVIFRQLDELAIAEGVDWARAARRYCETTIRHHQRVAEFLQDAGSTVDDVAALLDAHATEVIDKHVKKGVARD